MFVETKTFIVKQGYGEELLKKFSGVGKIEKAEGFIELAVMRNAKKGDTEEIMVVIRWESQEAFTNWKKSDAHQAGHQGQKKERPEHIIDVKMNAYKVESIKTASINR